MEKPIAFMLHQGETSITQESILKALQEYTLGKYIIAKENEPYVHFHIVAELPLNDYNSFVAKYIKKTWKLRGRAISGLPKQYGKILHVKKPDKMIAYTLKQGCYISNIPETILKPFKDMAYTKDRENADREIRDKLLKYLENEYYLDHFKAVKDEHLQKAILRFLLKEKIRIRTRNMIDGYLLYVRQFSKHDFLVRKDAEYYYDRLYLF